MSKNQLLMVAITGIVSLAGCVATTTPETDSRFGEAMTLIKAQQTLNPAASNNTDPVMGLDGRAAKGAMDRYRKSFSEEPKEGASPSQQFNIGGGQSGGS